MEEFFIYCKKADFAAVSEKFNISPMLARIIRNRDITEDREIEKYLNISLNNMYSPFLMKDMEPACRAVLEAVEQGVKIRIMGDYDIDGVCSSYILEKYLEYAGADVDVDIPDRVFEGFGLNENMVKKAAEDGIGLIITCDNGISACEPVRLAENSGIKVVITDHHQVPEILPPADFIINPHQKDCGYPYKELCGGGVAFKLVLGMELLRNEAACGKSEYKKTAHEKTEYEKTEYEKIKYEKIKYERTGGTVDYEKLISGSPLLSELLSFAGFATVGDIVPLQDENRIIASEGIRNLRNGTNTGMNALIAERKIAKEKLSSHHIGFVLGPCINSAGRLESAKLALNLFETGDKKEAGELAAKLSALNDERKKLTEEGAAAVKLMLEEEEKNGIEPSCVMVFNLKNIHESVAGIIAGRIKEEYGRPAIILTETETGIKGSGRSTDDFNIIKAISAHPGLFEKFGGHEKACGFTLKDDREEELKKALNDEFEASGAKLKKKVWIDMQLPLEYISGDFIEELSMLEPFGMNNKKPLFAEKGLIVNDFSIIGKEENALKIILENSSGLIMNGIIFGKEKAEQYYRKLEALKKENGNDMRISVTYYPSINEYNGRKSLQLLISHIL